MNRFLFRRIFTALMVLTFIVGLPAQGISTAVSATASSVPWMMDNNTPGPDDCEDCNAMPLMSTLCPIVFCLGLTGIVLAPSEVDNHLSNKQFGAILAAKFGLPISPKLDPPRTNA
jgi:hypothetical protein